MEPINDSKQERIDIINSKIDYWTRIGNDPSYEKAVDHDSIYKILTYLDAEKYDVIHGTHTSQIMMLRDSIRLNEQKAESANFMKKRKYLKEIDRLKSRINFLINLDMQKHEEDLKEVHQRKLKV